MGGDRLSVFVPAYNVAELIGEVVAGIPEETWDRVVSCWIINDGSRDETAERVRVLARSNSRIKLIDFEENRGYGAVVREGLARCRGDDVAAAACLHGDGQYPASLVGEFFATLLDQRYDILQGSRIASGTALSGGMPLYKYVAGRTLTFFENRVFGLTMTDYHSGYLFYSRAALERIPFERLSHSFDFDLEVIASAQARGMKVGERPIPTRYAGEKSNLNPVRYGFRVLRVLVRYVAGRYRER